MKTAPTKPLSTPSRARSWLTRAVALCASAALVAVAIPVTAGPAAAAPKRILSGWLPYWTTADSVAAFQQNADLFSDISPFWHDAVKSGSSPSGIKIDNHSLGGATQAATLAELKGRGALVFPSITDGSGKGTMAETLKSTAKRTALVGQITSLVNTAGYDGIDLDFETFAFSDGNASWASTRPAWVQFVTELGTALHAAGKQLSMAVPPMFDTNRTSSSGYWVYDYAGVAPYIDKLRIMAYDYSWSTAGPVGGPLSWAEKIVAFAITQIPASKVQLGTPTYGRDWVKSKSGSGCPSLSTKVYDSKDLATAIPGVAAARWQRDPASQEMFVNYTATYNSGACTVTRSAWLPDATTVVKRAEIANKYGLSGIAEWTIGGEDATQWTPLRNYANGLTPSASSTPTPTATTTPAKGRAQRVVVRATKAKIRPGKIVTIRGKITPSRKGAVAQLLRKQGKRWVLVSTATTTVGGVYRFAFQPTVPKSTVTFMVKAPGVRGYAVAYSPRLSIRTKR